MNLTLLLLLLLAVLFKWTDAQRSDIVMPRNQEERNNCITYVTCSECLQQAGCAWCSEKGFSVNGKPLPRCNPVDWFDPKNGHLLEASCGLEFVINSTQRQTIQNQKDDPLGDKGNGNQLRPQRVVVQTGPHNPINLQVQFRRLAGYPVDLYYIMDLSTSMKASKDKLVNLAASLAEAMRNITNDFQMGFGSFIDKPINPFTNEVQASKPYLFRHHLKLSKDSTTFALQVNSAPTFDNLDSPEGGLEALMQAVVCTKEIGWRSNSHRLLIFSTDAPYHLAGDGKLAGIIMPNDESCHVFHDRDGRFHYDHYRWLDYPSMAQISRQIANNSINVIFAVPGSVASTYRDLSSRLLGASVGELTNDSSNIVALIQDQYNKISSSVKMSHRASEFVNIEYSSTCNNDGQHRQPRNTNTCDRIKTGSTVVFDITVSVKKCRNGQNFKEMIEFFPIGVNEVMTVELDVSCQCDCDHFKSVSQVTGSVEFEKECNGAGKFKCGYCVCDPGFSGPSCECVNGVQPRTNKNAKGCKPPHQGNSSDVPNCSGRGNCICDASCECHSPPGRKVWGDYCECDACPVSPINEQICSGPLQGICPCNGGGACQCKPGWQGDSCQFECPESQENCKGGNSITENTTQLVCSGQGTCNCGKCFCTTTKESPYTGAFCEIPPCKELKDCVQCKAFESGPLTKEECDHCKFEVEKLEEIAETKDGDVICSFQDEFYCNFFFVHNRIKLEPIIRVRRSRECSEPPNIVAIVSGVAGAILAIGLLLLLLWKILTTVHDRLEYARFLRDRDLAKWDRGDNPIYKRPTTVFLNPAYTNGSEN